jgi:hypothetical protein
MSKGRRKPIQPIRWTIAEKINASVWAVEWGVTVFCVASAFASIVVTRTDPTYVFLPTTLAAVTLAAFSFAFRGKLRAVLHTQDRAEKEITGRFRIQKLYGNTEFFLPIQLPAAGTPAAERTQRFTSNQIQEYSS